MGAGGTMSRGGATGGLGATSGGGETMAGGEAMTSWRERAGRCTGGVGEAAVFRGVEG